MGEIQFLQERELLVVGRVVGHDRELAAMMNHRFAADIFDDGGIAAASSSA